MKPFPVVWKIDNKRFTEVKGGFAPITEYSIRNTFTIKPSIMMDGLPEYGSIVMIQLTTDTSRSYLQTQKIVLRVWPIQVPDVRVYPELHFVWGYARHTTRGGWSKTDVYATDKQLFSTGQSSSRTGNHGMETWLILLQPGESFTFKRRSTSNVGNYHEVEREIKHEYQPEAIS